MSWFEVRHPETGEVFDVRRRRRPHPYGYAWHTVSDEHWHRACRALTTKTELRVFQALPCLMRPTNVLVVSHEVLAEYAGVYRPDATKAMATLRHIWVVAEIEGVRIFSPEIAWKGRTEDLWSARDRWRKEIARQISGRRAQFRAEPGGGDG